ncbi:protein nsp-interacting kinase 3 [Quercus suber]|uniref:Protein nsp-interacting kinase 3 n=1 Tax=Quercus suber TaxID=58331 RepID=A0AAW0KSM0_QUESU
MERSSFMFWKVGLLVLALMEASSATLSPTGINYEVVALMAIKNDLNDPRNVLENWDSNSVDPCSWRMVTCTPEGSVSAFSFMFWKVGLLVLALMEASSATLSPTGINYEVVALMAIKNDLNDPRNVLENWDSNSVDPCSWRMVTCTPEGSVSALGLPSQSLSGIISPAIGNLSNLQSVLLQNNAISGPIPSAIGRLVKLQTLDLSNNTFSGEIPSSLGDLTNLNYLRLNNNSLTGPCPESLSKIEGLTLMDLSFNNLSGSLPKISARTFKIIGNPLICGAKADNNCSAGNPEPLSFPPGALKGQSDFGGKSHHVIIAFGASFSAVFVIILIVGFVVWWRYRHNQQIFFDVNDQYDPEVCLGHLRRYTFKELRAATDHFNSKNILGRGGFGIVYKGCLNDGTLVAVKRLKDFNAAAGEIQFQTEVEMISLAVHRNLLRLCGFCSTENERLLVYPYMPNGSVASRLRGHKALDFGRVANQKGVMLDWVKKLHQEGKLSQMVDKDLKGNFDRVELEEMVQVALLCTQFNPSHRPKMSEVLKMLEGDGLAEKWEASQKVETPRFRSCENPPQRYSDFIEESSLVIEAMELSGPR